jgi:hypothetical protein
METDSAERELCLSIEVECLHGFSADVSRAGAQANPIRLAKSTQYLKTHLFGSAGSIVGEFLQLGTLFERRPF